MGGFLFETIKLKLVNRNIRLVVEMGGGGEGERSKRKEMDMMTCALRWPHFMFSLIRSSNIIFVYTISSVC